MDRRRPTQWLGYGVAAACILCIGAIAVWRWGLSDKSGNSPDPAPLDLSQYRQITPQQLAYREEAAISLELRFSKVRSLSLDAQGSLYVVGDRLILKHQLKPASSIYVPLGIEPQCLAVAGDLWYVGTHDHVEVGSAGGIMKPWPSLGERANIVSLAVTNKDVFLADAGNRVVWRCDLEGKVLGQIGKPDPKKDIDGFIIPSPHFQVAVAPDGLVRASNPGRLCVEAYTLAGDQEWRWGQASVSEEGFSGCCNPATFAIFPDGRFVTAEKGELAMVKIFSADGPEGAKMQAIVAGPAQFPELRRAGSEVAPVVAAGADGTVYVLDPVQMRVRVFVPNEASSRAASAPTTAEARP